jgi:hypothetical protein
MRGHLGQALLPGGAELRGSMLLYIICVIGHNSYDLLAGTMKP